MVWWPTAYCWETRKLRRNKGYVVLLFMSSCCLTVEVSSRPLAELWCTYMGFFSANIVSLEVASPRFSVPLHKPSQLLLLSPSLFNSKIGRGQQHVRAPRLSTLNLSETLATESYSYQFVCFTLPASYWANTVHLQIIGSQLLLNYM